MKPTHTPIRAVRAPNSEWHPAQAEAARRGETMTDAIREFLRFYAAGGVLPPTPRLQPKETA